MVARQEQEALRQSRGPKKSRHRIVTKRVNSCMAPCRGRRIAESRRRMLRQNRRSRRRMIRRNIATHSDTHFTPAVSAPARRPSRWRAYWATRLVGARGKYKCTRQGADKSSSAKEQTSSSLRPSPASRHSSGANRGDLRKKVLSGKGSVGQT